MKDLDKLLDWLSCSPRAKFKNTSQRENVCMKVFAEASRKCCRDSGRGLTRQKVVIIVIT